MTLLIPFFALLLAVSFAFAMLLLRPNRETRVLRGRLLALRNPARAGGTDGTDLLLDDWDDASSFRVLSAALQKLPFFRNLSMLLLQSGTGIFTFHRFLAVSAVLAAAVFFASILLTHTGWLACAATAGAGAVPYSYLRFHRSRRLKAFERILPEASDLMARALRAGHSVQQAFEMIAEQMRQPLAGEFAKLHQEQKFGIAFREAVMAMTQRVPSPDLHFILTAILIQKETGGDLVEILDRTTAIIRERVRVEGEVKTFTAQGRLTGWILSLLPVVMLGLISAVAPSYGTILFHDPMGHKLLAFGGVMIAIGALLIRKIVRVEV